MRPVEWVLVVYYGPEAHRATYGRKVRSNRYTKDFIQLSRKKEFLEVVGKLFGINPMQSASVPLTYRWHAGSASGDFVFHSSDRPHLKWGTQDRAPRVWKMSPAPSESTHETIPGDPAQLDFDAAENEFAMLAKRGAGQPYLLAIKLRDEPRTLHLRAYLANPSKKFAWADLQIAPAEIQDLAKKTSQRSALAWSVFPSGGVPPEERTDAALSALVATKNPETVIDALGEHAGRALASYLQQPAYGLFFNSKRNHDPWLLPKPLPAQIQKDTSALVARLQALYPTVSLGDAAVEQLDVSPQEVEGYREQIQVRNYEVPDSHATVKTRGSAQKAFADAVKKNYGFQCAVTGIETREFLVASHIVPWSEDQTIRLDPSNGICLSLLVDRAFEKGHLLIADDLTLQINWGMVGDDAALRHELEPYDGKKLRKPKAENPKVAYLQRRRALRS